MATCCSNGPWHTAVGMCFLHVVSIDCIVALVPYRTHALVSYDTTQVANGCIMHGQSAQPDIGVACSSLMFEVCNL
jgi:hypothetical protein